MPMFTGTIEIGRPVEEVFAYIAEPKNNLEWEKGVEVNEWTSEGPIGVGSKGRRVDNDFGRDEYVWEVTEWKPNELWAMKAESDKFIGHVELRTELTDGGTRLTYRFEGNAKKRLFKLLMPLFLPMGKRKSRKDFQRLKGILESRS